MIMMKETLSGIGAVRRERAALSNEKSALLVGKKERSNGWLAPENSIDKTRPFKINNFLSLSLLRAIGKSKEPNPEKFSVSKTDRDGEHATWKNNTKRCQKR